MGKFFNVNGLCIPGKHYMVDIGGRLEEIRQLIDKGEYFTINRGRQFGKTTTLALLQKMLSRDYAVFFVSFEGLDDTVYADTASFYGAIFQLLFDAVAYDEVTNLSDTARNFLSDMIHTNPKPGSITFSNAISTLCRDNSKPVVLIIDEVDQSSNHKAFLDFLGALRSKYLQRERRPTFQSVILAGVYDIKNLKLKIRQDEEHQYNSPWNIAAKFTVDMSFLAGDIEGMLKDYEKEHQTGMDTTEMAELIYDYTSGYPYLVSELCKIMDERLLKEKEAFARQAWSCKGVMEAVKILLAEENTLFDDMRKKLSEFPELRHMLYEILYQGRSFPYNNYNSAMDIARMFGYIVEQHGKVMVANRIFETWLYNLFVSEESLKSRIYAVGSADKNQFVTDGHLDMELVLRRFVEHFTELYGNQGEQFLEEEGRKYFLFYLKPIINGTGNYYVEARTRDERRTDVIVDYLGEQFVIEMKIWHGREYNSRGEQQLLDYLESYHLEKGYLLSFNFNKKKGIGVKHMRIGEKIIVEAVV